MENYRPDIVRLIRLYLSGSLSEEEQKELETWLEEKEDHRHFLEEMRQTSNFAQEFRTFQHVDVQQGWKQFTRTVVKKPSRRSGLRRLPAWIKYAAILLLPLAIALSLLWRNEPAIQRPSLDSSTMSVGYAKATLTLSNGKQLQLSHSDSTEINLGDTLKAVQQAQHISYLQTKPSESKQMRYNTLEVPRGGEFRVTLSDGTVVHLNSGSKLIYPEVFAINERQVKFQGEGYFEVTKDTERPFYVITEEISIKVYGTEFNVNTLKAGKVETVLVEGKIGVQVHGNKKEYTIMPGQLADYNREKKEIGVKKVDIMPYVAWKDGIFCFEDQSLEEILNTLSLWYDVNVFYQNQEAKALHFTGHLRRYDDISIILEAISEATGVDFSLKEQTLIIK